MISKSIKSWLETKHRELRVTTSAEQALITPKSGKKLRIYGVQASQMVVQNLTATVRASLSFGTDGVSDPDKVLFSSRLNKKTDATEGLLTFGMNVVGDIDEPITLTNITFSAGSVVTRAIVYYNEE